MKQRVELNSIMGVLHTAFERTLGSLRSKGWPVGSNLYKLTDNL